MLTEVDLQHPTLHSWYHGCLCVGRDQRSHCLPPSLGPFSSDKGQLGCRKGRLASHPGSTQSDIKGNCRRLQWWGMHM